jgi:hypothetical protein
MSTGQPRHELGQGVDQAQRGDLARRQAELVRALVAGTPTPEGFREPDVSATRTALLRKRAGEVARTWPALAAAVGRDWPQVFAGWADGRQPQGSLRDGWDYARAYPPAGAAALELAIREATWAYDGSSAPRPRRGLTIRRVGRVLILRWRGRVWLLPRHRA